MSMHHIQNMFTNTPQNINCVNIEQGGVDRYSSQPRILTSMDTINNTLMRSRNSMSSFSLWYFLDVSSMLCKLVFTSSWMIFLNPSTNDPIITIMMLSLTNLGLFVKMLANQLTTSDCSNAMINMKLPTSVQKLDILLAECKQKSRINFAQPLFCSDHGCDSFSFAIQTVATASA